MKSNAWFLVTRCFIILLLASVFFISPCCGCLARVQTVSGGAAFLAVLALSQALQGAVLRVSCATPLGIPTGLGEKY